MLEDCPDAVHAFINAFSPKNRTYFLVSGGPPVPVLRVDLMPSGSSTRVSRLSWLPLAGEGAGAFGKRTGLQGLIGKWKLQESFRGV